MGKNILPPFFATFMLAFLFLIITPKPSSAATFAVNPTPVLEAHHPDIIPFVIGWLGVEIAAGFTVGEAAVLAAGATGIVGIAYYATPPADIHIDWNWDTRLESMPGDFGPRPTPPDPNDIIKTVVQITTAQAIGYLVLERKANQQGKTLPQLLNELYLRDQPFQTQVGHLEEQRLSGKSFWGPTIVTNGNKTQRFFIPEGMEAYRVYDPFNGAFTQMSLTNGTWSFGPLMTPLTATAQSQFTASIIPANMPGSPEWERGLRVVNASFGRIASGHGTAYDYALVDEFRKGYCQRDARCDTLQEEINFFYALMSQTANQSIYASMDDAALVRELSRSKKLATSHIHISAAARICRQSGSDPNNQACRLLAELVPSWMELQLPNSPRNKTILEIARDGNMTPNLRSRLKKNHPGLGPIEDTDKIFSSGRNLFLNWVIRGYIGGAQFREIQWTLLINGYSLMEWTEKGPVVLVNENVEALGLRKDHTKSLKSAGFIKVGDILVFIGRKMDLWEDKLGQQTGTEVVGPLKEALVKAGYGPEVLPLSRQ